MDIVGGNILANAAVRFVVYVMEGAVHTKLNTAIRKTLYGMMVLGVVGAVFGAGNTPAPTQEPTTETPSGVIVKISTDKASYNASENVIVHVIITNPNDHAIKVLKWFTPYEDVERPLFTVTRDGEQVTYLGIMVKRAAPTEQDYITLTTGGNITKEVNLSAYYDLSVSGIYEVKYDVSSIQLYLDVDNGQLNGTGNLASNTLSLFIEGRATPAPATIAP